MQQQRTGQTSSFLETLTNSICEILASLDVPVKRFAMNSSIPGNIPLNEHFSALWWTYLRHLDSKPLVLLPHLDGFYSRSGGRNEFFEKAAFSPYGHHNGDKFDWSVWPLLQASYLPRLKQTQDKMDLC
jgi:hypothetical protein